MTDNDTVYAGSLKAILYELKHGNVWTLIDEIWHISLLEWIAPETHWRFCQWAHRND